MRAVCAGVILLVLVGYSQAQEKIGHLLHHRWDGGKVHQVSEPYHPREGDLVFFDDHSVKWGLLYKLVGSDAPYHVALVIKKPDGSPATIEAGPNDTLKCRVMELAPRLYDWESTLLIRRCKKTLTAEQSAALTKWSMEQNDKRYALGRLLLQATPIRARGPIRESLFGATRTDRSSYLCAEMAVAGGAVAGIFDPRLHKGNTIYPRDIIFNDVNDLSALYDDPAIWIPTPSKAEKR